MQKREFLDVKKAFLMMYVCSVNKERELLIGSRRE